MTEFFRQAALFINTIQQVLIAALLCATFAWCFHQGLRRYDATLGQQACEDMAAVARHAARVAVGVKGAK